MELNDEQFIALVDDIDAAISDLCMNAYDKYDVMPIHLVSIMLGRMGVLMRELNDLDTFKKVMESAVMTIDGNKNQQKVVH